MRVRICIDDNILQEIEINEICQQLGPFIKPSVMTNIEIQKLFIVPFSGYYLSILACLMI